MLYYCSASNTIGLYRWTRLVLVVGEVIVIYHEGGICGCGMGHTHKFEGNLAVAIAAAVWYRIVGVVGFQEHFVQ